MTKTKLLGLVLFLLSNSYLAFSWQSWSVQVAGMYIILSVLEYFLLLSAVDRMPLVEHWMQKLSSRIHYTPLKTEENTGSEFDETVKVNI